MGVVMLAVMRVFVKVDRLLVGCRRVWNDTAWRGGRHDGLFCVVMVAVVIAVVMIVVGMTMLMHVVMVVRLGGRTFSDGKPDSDGPDKDCRNHRNTTPQDG
jgi:hypothetical protein